MTPRQKKKKRLSVDTISIAVTAAAAILSVSDTIKHIPGLPDWVSHVWPQVIMVAILVRTVGHAIITSKETTNGRPDTNTDVRTTDADSHTKSHSAP